MVKSIISKYKNVPVEVETVICLIVVLYKKCIVLLTLPIFYKINDNSAIWAI